MDLASLRIAWRKSKNWMVWQHRASEFERVREKWVISSECEPMGGRASSSECEWVQANWRAGECEQSSSELERVLANERASKCERMGASSGECERMRANGRRSEYEQFEQLQVSAS